MLAEKARRLSDDRQRHEVLFPPRRARAKDEKGARRKREAALTETENPASIAEAGFSMRIFQQIFSSMVC